MKFRCPCCKHQIVPSNESFEEDAQNSFADSESSHQFISIAIGTTDSTTQNEMSGDVPEVIVETGNDDAPIQDNSSAAGFQTSGL